MITTQLSTETVSPRSARSASSNSASSATSTVNASAPNTANVNTRILPTGSLFDTVGVVLDLSLQNRDLSGAYGALDTADRSVFLDTLSGLLKQGIVGNETLDVDGQPYTTDVTTRLGDPRLMHARPYGNERGALRLDVRA